MSEPRSEREHPADLVVLVAESIGLSMGDVFCQTGNGQMSGCWSVYRREAIAVLNGLRAAGYAVEHPRCPECHGWCESAGGFVVCTPDDCGVEGPHDVTAHSGRNTAAES